MIFAPKERLQSEVLYFLPEVPEDHGHPAGQEAQVFLAEADHQAEAAPQEAGNSK